MNKLILILAAAVALLASRTASAQYTIDWHTIDGGGAMRVTTGTFEISSTIGQPDAGVLNSATPFTAVGGFWVVGQGAACPADFNDDGFLDFFDYGDYVNCFENGICPPGKNADFNGDGFADFFDYGDFVAAFEAGC